MAQRRRWSAVEFRQLLRRTSLAPPPGAAPAVGASSIDGQSAYSCLRVAEDLSYADANDDLLTLHRRMLEIGLVHAARAGVRRCRRLRPDLRRLRDPAALPAARARGLPPQRCRRTRHLRDWPASRASKSPPAACSGWRTAAGAAAIAQDGGWIGWFTRRLGDDLEVELEPRSRHGGRRHQLRAEAETRPAGAAAAQHLGRRWPPPLEASSTRSSPARCCAISIRLAEER
jgi:hypothetical protein